MIQIFNSLNQFRHWRETHSSQSIGFVPTMGALHGGHESLLERARQENDLVVMSLFVNPTQFNNPDDFKNYPNTWDSDLAIATRNQVDGLLSLGTEDFYPDEYRYRVTENELSSRFCGAHRPGHFEGVLTIVMKLFNVVAPQRAYFGEKDYQQLKLVEGMVRAFFMNVQVIPVETVRESDGLAMSSRNRRLTEADRVKAPSFYQTLKIASSCEEARRQLSNQGFLVDYVEEYEGRRLGAAFLGPVRLIDNVKI
jgi:pantoate--beta-alanine ligase